MEEFLSKAFSVALLVFGFGFVIFWHELGHFLAAKWVGIKVEQFAVGMGHALVSFRKGIGVKLGNTRGEFDRRVKAHLDSKSLTGPQEEYSEVQKDRAAAELGLGETEYRLSWIPVGGYVKMLGQDDTRAGADVEDPRAYNKKTIPQRMLVVSAGVIMNIILAGILFMVLFVHGFRAPAPVVGTVQGLSPAQAAGFRPGDKIVSFNGTPQHDFTKVQLNTALAATDEPMKVVLDRNGERIETQVQPIRPVGSSKSFLTLGITPAPSLQGRKASEFPEKLDANLASPVAFAIKPGDVIKQVNGKDVGLEDFAKLDAAIQGANGKPVELTVQRKDGTSERVALTPRFEPTFGAAGTNLSFAGLQPRIRIDGVMDAKSPAYNVLRPDDVVVAVGVRNASMAADQPAVNVPALSVPAFVEAVDAVGQKEQSMDLRVLRDGKEVLLKDVKPTRKIEGKYKLGVAPGFDDYNAVVGGVLPGSPAANAKDGIREGSTIKAIDGKPVANWFDVKQAMIAAGAGNRTLTILPPDSQTPVERTLAVAQADVDAMKGLRAEATLALHEWTITRQTNNPLTALGWGVLETRDLILQFYVTLQRMFGGSISPANLMGPVGIFDAGAKFAFKGNDWLLWFLAMISANLAVVNFLPIPIVDGGLFLFLIIEKIQGRPLSRRAQEIAQFAGLALILGVFIMVTYNDIARFFN